MTATRTADPAESAAVEAPVLSLDQLRKELERLHQHRHRTLRTAMFARLAEPPGVDERLDVAAHAGPQRFRVVEARGELELRRKLMREETEATVYVVPFARQLPRDLEAGLAGGRLFLPEAEGMLARRFGAKTVTPRMRGSRLRAFALTEGARVYSKGEAASIDLDEGWLLVLRDRMRAEHAGDAAQLLAGALLDRERRGPAFAEALGKVSGASEELAAVLERRMGPTAPVVLAAWLGDAAVELAVLSVVGEAARTLLLGGGGVGFAVLTSVVEARIGQAPGHPLREVRKAGTAGLVRALVELGHLVPLFWPRLGDPSQEPLRRAILGEAEKLLGNEHVRPFAQASNRLPFVLEDRCRAFVDGLAEVVAAGDAAAAGRAIARVDAAATALLAHEGARGDGALREQIEMASRLAAFLGEEVARSAAVTPGDGPLAEVQRLAAFQAAAGGWVDWARHVVRGDVSGLLGRGLGPLLAEVDRVRDALDARFATAYAALVGKKGDRGALRGPPRGPGAAEVVPIEDALAHVGLPLLSRAEGRELRLLILCMDGMSTANAAELWASFEVDRASGAASIPGTSLVPVSAGPRRPVLAHVPTLTELSRSALFAGRALAPGESLDTQRDGDRLAKHAAMKAVGEAPVVLLRRDILEPGGGLTADARAAVGGKARVVAVVVNAIDDQLKGSAQLRIRLTLEHILPLKPLLEEADGAGRLVLLTSDHGHVPWQRMLKQTPRGASVEGAEMGARHRTLGAGEQALADEVELPAGALGGPGGAGRLAVAVHEGLRYTATLGAGKHGGVSLAETVVPAVLLAPRGLLPVLAELRVTKLPVEPPRFWDRDGARAEREVSAASAAPEPPPRPAAPVVEGAGKRPSQAPPRRPVQGSLPLGSPLAEALFASELFVAQARDLTADERPRVERAIELLARHGGRMTRDRLAAEMGLDAGGRSVRVLGFLTSLEKVLNVDGEPIVGTDARGQIVTLDLRGLRRAFLEDEGG